MHSPQVANPAPSLSCVTGRHLTERQPDLGASVTKAPPGGGVGPEQGRPHPSAGLVGGWAPAHRSRILGGPGLAAQGWGPHQAH